MGNLTISVFIIVLFLIAALYFSQQKFKNKMLCYFIRPNKQKIEQWVPLDSQYVIFDGGRYAQGSAFTGKNKGRYFIDPDCITMMWYTRGINKLFPVLIPTLEFKWDTPNPLDPKTFQSTWKTPDVMQAGWEGHEHKAFAKGLPIGLGQKSRFPEWLFPVIIAGLILIVLYIVHQGMSGVDHRLFDLEQQIKLLLP